MLNPRALRRFLSASSPVSIFSENLRTARLRRGWTQKELATASGMTQSAIANYESGQRNPTGIALIKISAALTVSPDWLGQGLDEHAKSDIDGTVSTLLTSVATRRPHTTASDVSTQNWPFRRVSLNAYKHLSRSQKEQLERMVEAFIKSCEPDT